MDLNDRAVIHQAVHCRHRHGAGGEDVLPLAERLVACDQEGSALVARAIAWASSAGIRRSFLTGLPR